MIKKSTNEFWQIVPKGDGYHFLCINEDSEYFWGEKRKESDAKIKLIYRTREDAQNLIDKHMQYIPEFDGSKEYVVENFWVWQDEN